MYYSTDKENWDVWSGYASISSGDNNELYLRGVNNTHIIRSGSMNTGRWILTGSNISCSGNIENLLDYNTVLNGEHPTMDEQCFSSLFSGCTALLSAPELPAITLTTSCYGSMFNGCTSLKKAPKLPAATLAQSCYNNMFNGCINLVEPPELPATSLVNGCYGSMFTGCTSLTKCPELPATVLANYCYEYMFMNCTSLISIPQLLATTLPAECYHGMFIYCTSIKLSLTKTDSYTQKYCIPFDNSTVISTGSQALSGMFTQTGGTFSQVDPTINTYYYLDESCSIVPEPAPTKTETWIINSSPDVSSNLKVTISFESNNTSFSTFNISTGSIIYDGTLACRDGYRWSDNAYKTVIFDSPVTDATLLAWLQANAVKQ